MFSSCPVYMDKDPYCDDSHYRELKEERSCVEHPSGLSEQKYQKFVYEHDVTGWARVACGIISVIAAVFTCGLVLFQSDIWRLWQTARTGKEIKVVCVLMPDEETNRINQIFISSLAADAFVEQEDLDLPSTKSDFFSLVEEEQFLEGCSLEEQEASVIEAVDRESEFLAKTTSSFSPNEREATTKESAISLVSADKGLEDLPSEEEIEEVKPLAVEAPPSLNLTAKMGLEITAHMETLLIDSDLINKPPTHLAYLHKLKLEDGSDLPLREEDILLKFKFVDPIQKMDGGIDLGLGRSIYLPSLLVEGKEFEETIKLKYDNQEIELTLSPFFGESSFALLLNTSREFFKTERLQRKFLPQFLYPSKVKNIEEYRLTSESSLYYQLNSEENKMAVINGGHGELNRLKHVAELHKMANLPTDVLLKEDEVLFIIDSVEAFNLVLNEKYLWFYHQEANDVGCLKVFNWKEMFNCTFEQMQEKIDKASVYLYGGVLQLGMAI